ncbi:M20 family metallopeptidase [Pseudohalocynthiibacter aestuariivivens]|nr:M20/M25/M40 family metallo-hydrolase [Pseudohalocynthiibacter aestuariivivens]QIE45300.1 M20 family metallopeptidase [Pseudohalocynthiibacter aestuariivivens]
MSTLSKLKQELVDQVDRDRDLLVEFLSKFVRAKSPNPPGDTRDAARCVTEFLKARDLEHRIVSPHEEMPNVIASFDCGAPGRHLVLNGHMDVFPLPTKDGWSRDPWGGEVSDGKVWGVGSCDMKQGTTSILFAYAYLHQIRDKLKGRLTLTAVSDEETFGPWGAVYLMENCPEIHGDCCFNAEPGAPTTVRIGEKAPLWMTCTVESPGAHAAYTHKAHNPVEIASAFIADLEAVEDLEVNLPGPVADALAVARDEIDRVHLKGAADVMQSFSLNIGQFNAGSIINTIPTKCTFDVDIRLPFGMTKEPVMAFMADLLEKYPQVKMEVVMDTATPAWSDPSHELVGYVQQNAKEVAGLDVLPITSLAGTDARLWRYAGIPAFSYGTTATNVAMPDEHVDIEEWIGVVKTHLLTIFDYLNAE